VRVSIPKINRPTAVLFAVAFALAFVVNPFVASAATRETEEYDSLTGVTVAETGINYYNWNGTVALTASTASIDRMEVYVAGGEPTCLNVHAYRQTGTGGSIAYATIDDFNPTAGLNSVAWDVPTPANLLRGLHFDCTDAGTVNWTTATTDAQQANWSDNVFGRDLRVRLFSQDDTPLDPYDTADYLTYSSMPSAFATTDGRPTLPWNRTLTLNAFVLTETATVPSTVSWSVELQSRSLGATTDYAAAFSYAVSTGPLTVPICAAGACAFGTDPSFTSAGWDTGDLLAMGEWRVRFTGTFDSVELPVSDWYYFDVGAASLPSRAPDDRWATTDLVSPAREIPTCSVFGSSWTAWDGTGTACVVEWLIWGVGVSDVSAHNLLAFVSVLGDSFPLVLAVEPVAKGVAYFSPDVVAPTACPTWLEAATGDSLKARMQQTLDLCGQADSLRDFMDAEPVDRYVAVLIWAAAVALLGALAWRFFRGR